jgi:dephospho-CoA kinase
VAQDGRVKTGLTGGIAAGKSEVARLLRERGAVVIDADVLAREAVAPASPGLAAVVDAFGPGVLASDGSLDRPRLGQLVFADDDARHRLEEIVHPVVAARSAELMAAAPPGSVVVHDVPLLVEKHLASSYDLVVVVDAPVSVQVDRLVSLRGLSERDARARVAAQATREERLAVADVVIDNAGRARICCPRWTPCGSGWSAC